MTPAQRGYDVIILTDLIFNWSEHKKLLASCDGLLSPNGEIYCVFSHHRPKYLDKDMHFFHLAEHGIASSDEETQSKHGLRDANASAQRRQPLFRVEKLKTELHTPLFENDPGCPTVRSQVHFYRLTR